jgi:predicted MFS family arabinose efflux permease
MSTSYRNIFLLACCQALLLANSAGLAALTGLVGYEFAANKALATLGVTTYVLGSAAASLPMALWMGRVGRQRGFMTGALVNIVGCALGAVALWQHSFALFCVATATIGVYNAIGLQYRFAAAEVAAPKDRARAISLVLAGGVLGGVIGPEAAKWSRTLFEIPFLGTFVALAGFALIALAVQSRVEVPLPRISRAQGEGRPLAQIMAQPVFIVAALCASLGYGLMNLLMTATPIAMSFCGYPFGAMATVIEWHAVAMFAPGFVTGPLIERFGVFKVISAGIGLMALATAVALHGLSVAHFGAALALVGVGWNFMYTGGTALLTESYAPSEKARVQGVHDLILFATMGVSSASSGALVAAAGWETANWAALPVLAVVAVAVLLLAWQRRAPRVPAPRLSIVRPQQRPASS